MANGNKKLENALKTLKANKTGKIILQAFAYRERDIRGTKDANGNPQYTMEIARMRTDLFNVGVKDGRDVIVPRKTEVKPEDFYAFFEKLVEVGACDAAQRGKENQILVVNFHYSLKAMGKFALGIKNEDGSEVELLTTTERDQKNAENRAKHVAAAKGGAPVARQAGPTAASAPAQTTAVGETGGGLNIKGMIQQVLREQVEQAIKDALKG